MNYKYLQELHRDEMVEGLPQIKSSTGACIGCVVGKHLERSYEKGKERKPHNQLGWYTHIRLFHFPLHHMVDQGMYLHLSMIILDSVGCTSSN